jgi:nucleotide-binding universal stress UspA family protein
MAAPTIVVGYDASPGAQVALDRALDLAMCLGDRPRRADDRGGQ